MDLLRVTIVSLVILISLDVYLSIDLTDNTEILNYSVLTRHCGKMDRRMLSLFIIASTLLVASLPVGPVSAFPDAIRERTFITYYGQPLGTADTDSYNVWAYSGIHWSTSNVAYYVNPKGAPVGALAEIRAAFETWDVQVTDELFNDDVGTVSRQTGNKFDGLNVVSWGRLGRGIIAVTTVWYNRYTNEIVEFGMVFSSAYKWGIDIDGEGSSYILVGMFDVRDIATHEAGHTLMLDDLYMPEASALTMYGYGSYGQTYAISLGAGDRSGVKAICP